MPSPDDDEDSVPATTPPPQNRTGAGGRGADPGHDGHTELAEHEPVDQHEYYEDDDWDD